MKENENQKSVFVSIVGRPNVGKSSLLNAMVGEKVAIVSAKPQTTRTRVTGVLTKAETQYVFTDTPGLLQPRNRLGEYMVKSVLTSVTGVDVCLLVEEAGSEISPASLELIAKFREAKMPAVLALNKIDLLRDKTVLMAQIADMAARYDFAAVVPVSAVTGNGVGDLLEELGRLAQPGAHFFDDDDYTDQPERVIAGEIVREKMLQLLSAEVPHGAAVFVDSMAERGDESGITDISATIYCEKESHKAIIIGKKGSMLKKIGTLARADMERFFGCRVNLQLWVRVKEDWRNREGAMRSLGYNSADLKG